MDIPLSNPEIAILKAVNKYDCLTVGQIQTVLGLRDYAETTRRLKRMTEKGLLSRKRLPPQKTIGNFTWLHKLGELGKTALFQEPAKPGSSIPRFDMGADPLWVSVHYWHTVYCNDFFIQAGLWANKNNAKIAHEKHETEIKRTKAYFPASVVLPDGTKTGVIPDGWLDLRCNTKRFCFVLELETGTQQPAQIRRKINALNAFANGPYQQIFGTDNLTYVIVALEGERHKENIEKIIAESGSIRMRVLAGHPREEMFDELCKE